MALRNSIPVLVAHNQRVAGLLISMQIAPGG